MKSQKHPEKFPATENLLGRPIGFGSLYDIHGQQSGLVGEFAGVGLHSGRFVTMRIHRNQGMSGIWFVRSDLPGRPRALANISNVRLTPLSTTVFHGELPLVSTIEHVMAALWCAGIDSAVIEVNGPEVPILDGSAIGFLGVFRAKMNGHPPGARRFIRVRKTVAVSGANGGSAEIGPHHGFHVTADIDYRNDVIGHMRYSGEMTPEKFATDIAPARTFALERDIFALRARGLALGGSLDNAVVVGDTSVLNPGGLRFPDEFVRHKVLDAIGDLYLAGMPILGRYRGHRAGHALHAELLRALLSDPTAWDILKQEDWDPRHHGFHRPVATTGAVATAW